MQVCERTLAVFVGWPWLSFGRWKGRVNWYHYEASALWELNYCLSQVRENVKKQKRLCSSFSWSTSTERVWNLVLSGYSSTWTSLVQSARAPLAVNRLRCPAQSSPALRHKGCREGRVSSRMTLAYCAVLCARIAGTAGLASDTRHGRRHRSPRTCI